MARLHRGKTSGIVAAILVLLVGLYSDLHARPADDSDSPTLIYDRPVLRVDPGMHTSQITDAAVDEAGRFVVTGSYDKTVRIWSLEDGKLLQTIRLPAGPGSIGKVYTVAMSPDGDVVAAGGWTSGNNTNGIYLLARSTGAITERINVSSVTIKLRFSSDGRYLAAGLKGGGLRIFDRSKDWAEVFQDENYRDAIYGISFAGDGRLATASLDGEIRLYDQDFRLLHAKKGPGGNLPVRLAFSPDGADLAVVYNDKIAVDVLDGHTLTPNLAPNVDGMNNGNLVSVAWARDGQILFAGGLFDDGQGSPVVAWADRGHGKRRTLPAGQNTVSSLTPLPGGRLLVATQDPVLAVLENDGSRRWEHQSPKAEFRGQSVFLAVSPDASIVDFGFESGGKTPLRFDLNELKLTAGWPTDNRTLKPKQDGLPIGDWNDSDVPTLNGRSIELTDHEYSYGLAINPNDSQFVLGTDFFLRAIDSKGAPVWTRQVPGAVWAVNIAGDGRLVVAAYDDGTIRWHRMDDGRELLALMVLRDQKNWVVWTPEGFYAATPGARSVLQWHVNRGFNAAATTVPVSQIPKLSRPDALQLVLRELDTHRALGMADDAAARIDVQKITGAASALGARLQILAIGVSDYGDKAKQLHLEFAGKDAHDVASALLETQDGSLNKLGSVYAEINPVVLVDQAADKPGIFEAFASMQRNMAKGGDLGNDMAVVMFSGHGAIIDKQLYLLPYGVDARTPARIKASAILASEFRAEVSKIAQYGRVLVLLDACHSGMVATDGSDLPANADLLRALMAQNNVTVLTSSKADKLSHEDKKWGHGAFTKILLEALGRAADANANGMISMSELTSYIAGNLPVLTDGNQNPGIELRFQSDIFVAGL